MKLFVWVVLIFIEIAGNDSKRSSNRKKPTARIVNGEDATIQEYPFMASLIVPPTTQRHASVHVCGTTIIRKFWVLTAGHCAVIMDFYSEFEYVVRGNTTYSDERDSWYIYHTIAAHYIHEKYNHTNPFEYDIALIKVKEPFDGLFEKPLDIVGKNIKPKEESPASIVGWGITLNDNLSTPRVLQRLDLLIMNLATCKFLYRISIKEIYIGSQHICIGGVKYKSPCSGDSGGPLIQNGKALGITSFGAGTCGDNVLPAAYVNLVNFHDWIRIHTQY